MFNYKEYYKKDKERIRKYQIQWRKDNPDKVRESERRYCKKHPEKMREKWNRWTKNNPEKIKAKNDKYREDNPEKIKIYSKRYYEKNKEKSRKYLLEWKKNRRKTDLKYNLNCKISNAIYYSLKRNKGSRHWETLVGYTLTDLVKHLKKTMPKNYTWQDFLDGKLQVDHIIPISAWDFNKSEQINFQRCWALKNLRLLPAMENLRKNNHLEKPFQLALKI